MAYKATNNFYVGSELYVVGQFVEVEQDKLQSLLDQGYVESTDEQPEQEAPKAPEPTVQEPTSVPQAQPEAPAHEGFQPKPQNEQEVAPVQEPKLQTPAPEPVQVQAPEPIQPTPEQIAQDVAPHDRPQPINIQ